MLAPSRRAVIHGGLAVTGAALLRPRGARAATPQHPAGTPGVPLRFRQIHLDFHTPAGVTEVGAHFDPAAFADTLARAHVDSVTVFARCHHGYLYYPSEKFRSRIHPHLRRPNLLGEQITACHERGIRTPIYSTIMWDQFTVDEHPEWRQITKTGAPEGTPVYEPGFYRRLCLNSPYRDFLKAHLDELYDLVPVDGLFLDIVADQDCSCLQCRAEMRKRNWDPSNDDKRRAFGAEVATGWKKDIHELVRRRAPKSTLFFNGGHIGPGIKPSLPSYSHLELESLPSGSWGYLHFPLTARYARTLGKDAMGMTGKFHTAWGDFHSLKNPAALAFECFQMLALGAKCSIGDQLHPSGKLDPATYDLIGGVYAEVEKKEPWCADATPLTDIGVLSPEAIGSEGGRVPPAARGVVRILQELGQQFDVIGFDADFSRYRVLILPDVIPVDRALAAKLRTHLHAGRGLLASHASAAGPEAGALLGVTVKGDAPFSPDFIRARPPLSAGMPSGELVMYGKGLELVPTRGAQILADVVAPYFNRTFEHYFSHKHAPSTGKVAYPGVVRHKNAITFAHPVFTQYARNAPRWVKLLVRNALELLLPQPLVRHGGPSTLLTALNAQPGKQRLVLHLLHYIPERRGDEFDTIEDVLPLSDLKLSIRTDKKPRQITLVPGGAVLPAAFAGGRTEFTVPRLNGHALVEISMA